MMRVLVFKKLDGSVFVNIPSEKYQGGHLVDDLTKPIFIESKTHEVPVLENGIVVGHKPTPIHVGYEKKELKPEDAKLPDFLNGLAKIEMEINELISVANGCSIEELYFDGECLRENLKLKAKE